jgi:two-component system sensor histidine kinase KdpD
MPHPDRDPAPLLRRPDPDALLARIQTEEERNSRAKLKIFFGFAPGVGKTFRMLLVARELSAQGLDVVIGTVETHGRSDTAALVQGLAHLPRLELQHGGATLGEFDLDGALARHPKLLLLDELAHSNAPGARHTKRWQDVLELLHAGIDVFTTLNVQHIESLNDVVAQITHVQVRETVPDSILERADEIELVDLTADQLLQRLQEGKVYLPDQAARAAQHFFQRGNLLALRELALRQTADRVEADVQAQRSDQGIESPWRTTERILVCVGPSPASARLVRTTRRLAAGLHANWFAAYVESPLRPTAAADRQRLDAHLRLVEALGGSVVRLSGSQVSAALLDYASKNNISRIVIGKPTHSRLRDLIHGSLLDEVVRGSGDIDVHVISADAPGPQEPSQRPHPPKLDALPYGLALGAVAAATGLGLVGQRVLLPSDSIMLYLVGIMAVALRAGRGPSLFAAAASVAAYNFFFVPPLFTFSVHDGRHLLTFATMFVVGAVLSAMTVRIRQQEREARDREARTASLFSLSRDLSSATEPAEVAAILCDHVARGFGGAVRVVAGSGADWHELAQAGDWPLDSADRGLLGWVIDHGRPAGLGTETLPGSRALALPILQTHGGHAALGFLSAQRQALDGEGLATLQAYVRQGALALERAWLASVVGAAELRAKTEEMRSSLLSAVSHDLRTPLAAITGAATTLRDNGADLQPRQRLDLLEAICEEADRLERLVGNLLDMTRLASGQLQIHREWLPLEELTGVALARLEAALGARPIELEIPPDLPMVQVDPLLFGQVFVNLLENALKYTPADSPLEIRAQAIAGGVTVDLVDHGPGLQAELAARVFDKFVRGKHTEVGGAGLGLAICKGILDVHGGTIAHHPTPGGGATFRLTLPATESPPSLLEVSP